MIIQREKYQEKYSKLYVIQNCTLQSWGNFIIAEHTCPVSHTLTHSHTRFPHQITGLFFHATNCGTWIIKDTLLDKNRNGSCPVDLTSSTHASTYCTSNNTHTCSSEHTMSECREPSTGTTTAAFKMIGTLIQQLVFFIFSNTNTNTVTHCQLLHNDSDVTCSSWSTVDHRQPDKHTHTHSCYCSLL